VKLALEGNMPVYKIDRVAVTATSAAVPADLFKVGFGDPAQNDAIVRAAEIRIPELGELGGELALINGPASLPVAVVIAHRLLHAYGAIGVFDPKMSAYVVAAAHGDKFAVGDLIPAETVVES
jgi:CRISPR-associated protein Csx3